MSDEHRFAHDQYVVRKTFFKIFGEDFQIFGPDGELVLYSKLKAFKFKEDIRLWSDKSKSNELMSIKARGVIDFSMGYDVVDSQTGAHVGALKRKGFKSMLRDEWVICDSEDVEIGLIREESQFKALVRRIIDIPFLMPQKYDVLMSDEPVATFKQGINPFVQRLRLDFSGDTQNLLDPRLGIAAGVLIAAIEGRQSE